MTKMNHFRAVRFNIFAISGQTNHTGTAWLTVVSLLVATLVGSRASANPDAQPGTPRPQPPAQVCPAQIQVDFGCDAIGVLSTSNINQVVMEFEGGGTQRVVTTGPAQRLTLRGSGRFAHRRISGAWVKSGCNRGSQQVRCDPQYGQHFSADEDSCGPLAPIAIPDRYSVVVDPRVDAGYDIAEYELNSHLEYIHVSTLEDFEGATVGVADGLLTAMVHSEAELLQFLQAAHASLAGRIDELDEVGRPEIHAIAQLDLAWWRARVSTASVVADLYRIEPDGGNALSVSSQDLLATIGASTSLYLAGWQVGVEFQMSGASVRSGATNDRSGDLFNVRENLLILPMPPESAQIPNYGIAEAWRTLEIQGIPRGVANLYVVDKGFFQTPDLAQVRMSEQLIPHNGWGDESYEDDKPWHGTWVAHTLFGEIDNNWGFGGAAGPYPFFKKIVIATGYGPWLAHLSMSRHIDESPHSVFNMSFGAKIPIPFTFWANNLKRFTDKHFSSGRALFVASAGNDGDNVDKTWLGIEWRLYAPCELDGVVCVGGVNQNIVTRATTATTGSSDSQSNFGSEDVDLFGPYFVVDSVGTDPENATGSASLGVQGTSFASPFVAGCAAVIWDALGTSANSKDVLNILRTTAMRSNDKTVGRRVVQPFRAIQQILGNTAAVLTVTQNPSARNVVLASASAVDPEDGSLPNSAITWTFDPGLPSQVVQTGGSFALTLPDAAPHTLTVTAIDSQGLIASQTLVVQLVNSAPQIDVVTPADGATIQRGSIQSLFATVLDSEVDPLGPIQWTVQNVGSFTGNFIDVDTSTWQLGPHFISAQVSDVFGATSVSTVVVQVQDASLPIITVAPHSGILDFDFGFNGVFVTLSATATFADQPLPGTAISWTLPDGSVIPGPALNGAFISEAWTYFTVDGFQAVDVTVTATEPGGTTSSQVVTFFVFKFG